MTERKRPVTIEIGPDEVYIGPDEAPPVPDMGISPPEGRAMRRVLWFGGRRWSVAGRLFAWAAGSLVGLLVSVWAWDALNGLLARSTTLGYLAGGLLAIALLALLVIALRELSGIARLRKLDRLRDRAESAAAGEDLKAAQAVAAALSDLYRDRDAARAGLARVAERQDDLLDAEDLLTLIEVELVSGLDAEAIAEIEAAARQVATVTAIVPLAFADLLAALTLNIRMIRRIAEVYGGRAGSLGSWRLARAVLAHLVATGVVAVGDDMISSVAGGSVVSKLSRRFGEGIVNGALTARVGISAMELCRPLPFRANRRPKVTALVQRALTGLFSRGAA